MKILQSSLPGIAVVVACTAIVTVRVVLAPGPTSLRAATAEERIEIAQTVAAAELVEPGCRQLHEALAVEARPDGSRLSRDVAQPLAVEDLLQRRCRCRI